MPIKLPSLRAMDLNQLVALAALLRHAGVTNAARDLNISQPAMSRSLDRLRRQFDDPLLVREGNRMILTPRGKELLPIVDAALEKVDQVFSSLSQFDPSTARKRVRIGANDYLQHLFAPLMHALVRSKASNVILEFGPVGMLRPEPLLSQGIVDLIFGLTHPNDALRNAVLFEDELVCVACSQNYSLPEILDINTFSEQAHVDISPSGVGMLRAILDNSISAQGGQRRVVASVSTFHSVPAMLAGTNLLAIVPRRAAISMPKNIVNIRELSFNIEPYSVSLWWHNSTHNDPLFRWLREQITLLAEKLD